MIFVPKKSTKEKALKSMAEKTTSPHLLAIPFPSQGHLLPLLDLCHILSTRHNFKITIVTTPLNLPTLSPLLSSSPSISPLILPFPSSPSFPDGVENTYKLPPNLVRHLIPAFSPLFHPILHWHQSHPNPPTAIISDFFTSGWTLRLAQSLSIPRLSFYPSGAFAIATIHQLWRDMPPNSDPNSTVDFPSLPGSPSFPLSHLSVLYRSYRSGDPVSESIKNNFLSDVQSWGFVFNTFYDFEGGYVEHMMKDVAGHRRVWAVGPVAASASAAERKADAFIKEKALAWLDRLDEGTAVYICFGSQAVLSPEQAAGLAAALEISGVRFLWCVREGTEIPAGFEERVEKVGFLVKGWAPQVEILRHAAVGWFMSHCGWNSVVEAVAAGVPLLAWPRSADQFVNARMLAEKGMAVRVAEGNEKMADVGEMGRVLRETAGGGCRGERARAAELKEKATMAVAEGGSSWRDLEGLAAELRRMVPPELL